MTNKKVQPVIDTSADIWRKIPPEEKLSLMASSHSKGVGASLLVLATCGTVGVGLKLPEIFWSAFFAVPFVFQFVSSKSWRDLKPRLMLEYLAARSASRRYAFGTACKDLTITLIFKGELSFMGSQQKDDFEADDPERVVWKPVWISLFPDTIVMMSEQQGGAKLEMARTIDENLTLSTEGFESPKGSSLEKTVTLNFLSREGVTYSFTVRSHYPGALYVMERKIRASQIEQKAELEREKKSMKDLLGGPDLGDADSDMSFDLPSIN